MKECGLGVQAPSENAGGAPINNPAGSYNSDQFDEPSKGDPIQNLKKGLGIMGGGSCKKIKPINEEERKKLDGSQDGNASELKKFDESSQNKQIMNLGSKPINIILDRLGSSSLKVW